MSQASYRIEYVFRFIFIFEYYKYTTAVCIKYEYNKYSITVVNMVKLLHRIIDNYSIDIIINIIYY